MIQGFEEETRQLDDFEMSLIPVFIKAFKTHVGSENAVTSKAIIEGIETKFKKKLGGSRVRKIINHVRCEGFIKKLVASSKGYYIEEDKDELLKYIHSLEDRAGAIKAVAEALRSQI